MYVESVAEALVGILEEKQSTSSGRQRLVEVLWLSVGQTLLAEMSDQHFPEGLQKEKSPR